MDRDRQVVVNDASRLNIRASVPVTSAQEDVLQRFADDSISERSTRSASPRRRRTEEPQEEEFPPLGADDSDEEMAPATRANKKNKKKARGAR